MDAMVRTHQHLSAEERSRVHAIFSRIQSSPTPYHAVVESVSLLLRHGFAHHSISEPLPVEPGRYVVESSGSLVAWIQPRRHHRFVLVGAHTDSPNLRLKSRPDRTSANVHQLAMEIYGGVLLNSWLNRDLGLAGRVAVTHDDGRVENRLVDIDEPMLTIPQLAIHLDRDISSGGLTLNPQNHLVPMWSGPEDSSGVPAGDDTARGNTGGAAADGDGKPGRFLTYLAGVLGVNPDSVLSWDLMAYDLQAPAFIGRHHEFVASARIDNLLSSFCGVDALISVAGTVESADELRATPVLVLYDHEEIGSESATGAAGTLLLSMLERIAGAAGADRQEFLTSLNRSNAVSADGAHATHPNYADKHDPDHQIELNRGIVIKRNANQRYATDAVSEAFIVDACRHADVPIQYYIHRNDLPCGSTIGPITAARLGVPTVDIGAPQLAMHSIRETAGTIDAIYLSEALTAAWTAYADR
jgi:aspartyl aminopeptidase